MRLPPATSSNQSTTPTAATATSSFPSSASSHHHGHHRPKHPSTAATSNGNGHGHYAAPQQQSHNRTSGTGGGSGATNRHRSKSSQLKAAAAAAAAVALTSNSASAGTSRASGPVASANGAASYALAPGDSLGLKKTLRSIELKMRLVASPSIRISDLVKCFLKNVPKSTETIEVSAFAGLSNPLDRFKMTLTQLYRQLKWLILIYDANN